MNFPKVLRLLALGAAAALVSPSAFAQIDARMFRQPSVSKDQIAFVYAGDIWLVPRKGGVAVRRLDATLSVATPTLAASARRRRSPSPLAPSVVVLLTLSPLSIAE